MSAPRILSPTTTSGGTPVGGSGTPGTIPVWSGTGTTLTDSQLIQSATGIYTTTRNIGIGVDPGTVKLRITGGAPFDWTIRALASVNSGQSFGMLLDAGTNASDTAFRIRNSAANAEYLIVRGDGNVGIGTASPTAIAGYTSCTVNGTTGSFFSSFANGTIYGLLRAQVNSYALLAQGASTPLILGVQNAESMRIDSSSNVTIGPTGSGAKFEVTQILNTQGGVRIGLTAAPKNNYYNAEVHYFRGIDDIDKVTIDSVNKYVNASVATWGLKLPSTPSNGDAQTLDAYNELGSGTYKAVTATLTCGTSGTITLKSAHESLYVTRVGRTVIVSGFLQVDSVASPVGRLTITTSPALPACQAGASANIVFTGPTGLVAGDNILPTISASTIFCDKYNAGVQSQTAAANIQANTTLWVAFMYHAA